ncbi:MAG TPA: TetR/AcrR family transcriptional regulator [Opitutaceae bacterium]|jgi:AcrR family transcriptional regulator|nr:TetR/AcrR family transcriptional regulator [Opitutaceae bacterium]
MPPRRSPADTDARILAAAERTFAERGLDAATTRAIAKAAGVNEVTLFRRFGSKSSLLAAVVGKTFGRAADADAPLPSGSLRGDLEAFARRYEELLREHLLMVRTCIGEIHRHREYETRVLQSIFEPLRAALMIRLRAERAQVDPEIVADLLSAMILTAVLRDASRKKPRAYSAAQYRAAAIDAVLRLIA